MARPITTLTLHPQLLCDPVARIEVAASRSGPIATFRYTVVGSIADLVIPPPAAPERRDGLWQQTCFEVFARAAGEASYREFNFSPSGEWAAYRFDDYRSGMVACDLPSPEIRTESGPDRFELETSIALGPDPLQIALAAVIEEKGARKTYWALAHPKGKADFHHPDSFAYELS